MKWLRSNNRLKGNKKPPKNKIVFRAQIKIILAYSAKKKKTKIAAECSVIKPATNSDSASGKSKGARLVSAKLPIKKIRNNGNKGIINQIAFCDSTIELKLKEPINKTTMKIMEVNINS